MEVDSHAIILFDSLDVKLSKYIGYNSSFLLALTSLTLCTVGIEFSRVQICIEEEIFLHIVLTWFLCVVTLIMFVYCSLDRWGYDKECESSTDGKTESADGEDDGSQSAASDG